MQEIFYPAARNLVADNITSETAQRIGSNVHSAVKTTHTKLAKPIEANLIFLSQNFQEVKKLIYYSSRKEGELPPKQ